jgi:hypothetical protein
MVLLRSNASAHICGVLKSNFGPKQTVFFVPPGTWLRNILKYLKILRFH